MKITVSVPDSLWNNATLLTGLRSPSALVQKALSELISERVGNVATEHLISGAHEWLDKDPGSPMLQAILSELVSRKGQ